ncbi:DUF4325 domain-containing protein [Aggregicoccus sp. 17bor-14]|uniref:STAS-like domain-containing protein n=1 Tax=Myxococcaceae TaxID=31 RepID=UPI00129D06CF|nr:MULTISPECIES: STAS-like domain-containing protein [Myxococcaceae]MBF5043163.1 STAS-like domain-containing protein [Simulacricoccus sp. 17bor-14]MRI88922.1 DUF4325 domain-containing protein [Aggregicoccus sp. 17bor-14]
MSIEYIDLGKDYSKHLGPRYKRDGNNSGEQFREKVLEPAFLNHDQVVVNLDSIVGYSASFLEEAFGGLVRKHGLSSVQEKVRFDTIKRLYLVPLIESWMKDASHSSSKQSR